MHIRPARAEDAAAIAPILLPVLKAMELPFLARHGLETTRSLLAAAVEKIERGDPSPPATPLWRDILMSLIQELHKLLYFLALALPTLILALILPPLAPVLWFLYTAWCAALQYLDYPMANNAVPFRTQRARLRQNRADTLACGGAISLLTTIPVLNLVAMPVGVIAATLYWCRHLRQP